MRLKGRLPKSVITNYKSSHFYQLKRNIHKGKIA
jgi:hypothetical protein